MQFYLGTHEAHWLALTDRPLFVSRRRLAKRATVPRAWGRWALDSGAFTELSSYGEWRLRARDYACQVRRFQLEIGGMDWAAPQDWMCEPLILKLTKGSVTAHQRRTVRNYVALTEIASDLPWIPVLQGWTRDDYFRCIDLYRLYGVELGSLPLVGVGSVCRRQGTAEIAGLLKELASVGLRLHAFGVKTQGLTLARHYLSSSDSMAWSFDARRLRRRWCQNGTHKNCANCLEYALFWGDKIERLLGNR